MSAEYITAMTEARERLSVTCTTNLKLLQEERVEGKFSFLDDWGYVKQDSLTHPQIPVLNRLSRIALNFHKPTWVTYTYENGNISAELFQNIAGTIKSIQIEEDFDLENIPFNQFSENDLYGSARLIEQHLSQHANRDSQVV